MKQKARTSQIRLFFIVLFILLVAFLSIEWLAPRGTWVCKKNYNNNWLHILQPSCLAEPTPQERFSYGSEGELLVLADPLYLLAFSPRPFQKVEVEIIYRPLLSEVQAIFEAGFLADPKLWRYQLKPIYNYWLEESLATWTDISANGLSLQQKEKKYSHISEFITALESGSEADCLAQNCLALYNIDENTLAAKKIDIVPEGRSAYSKLSYSIRGDHQFYIYIADKNLELEGSFIDLNENKDVDDWEIVVSQDKQIIANLKIPDKRSEHELSGELSEDMSFSLKEADLTGGLYKLEIRAGNDIVVKDLRIESPYLSAINKLWIFESKPVSVYTDSSYLQVKTLSPLALQTLLFNGNKLELADIYQQYEIESNSVLANKIDLEKGGLILENNGVFSASQTGLLNPTYPKLDRFAFKRSNIDYILARYEKAERLDDTWCRSKLTFKGSDLYRKDNNYNLILSIPGLKQDANEHNFVAIKEIKIRYSGPNLLEKLRMLVFRKNK